MKSSIIIRPYITEKTMNLAMRGWYTFVVAVSANKAVIAGSIKSMYNVTPIDVRTSIMSGKTKKAGRRGLTKTAANWKKAIVKLKAGQTIDAFQIGEQQPEKK